MSEQQPRKPETAEEARLYARFLERQRAAAAQKEAEQRDKMTKVTLEIEHKVARALGEAADNGKGACRWCGMVLGHATDNAGVEYRTHPPVRECPGPPPAACELCRRAWWFDKTARRWTHECTAATRVAPAKTQIARPGGSGFFGYRREHD